MGQRENNALGTQIIDSFKDEDRKFSQGLGTRKIHTIIGVASEELFIALLTAAD